jgi:hypothetical protein
MMDRGSGDVVDRRTILVRIVLISMLISRSEAKREERVWNADLSIIT